MEAMSHELALRYLLELSTDIRLALLLDPDGGLVASAPERPDEAVARVARELAMEVRRLDGSENDTPVEVDVTVEAGAVFLVQERGKILLCLTGRYALPGLILHDMRVTLNDLRRGGVEEVRP
jgi:hypothetical protein